MPALMVFAVSRRTSRGSLKLCARWLPVIPISPLLAYELGRDPAEARETTLDDSSQGGEILFSDPILSPKEQEVLRCCLEGMSVSQIARKFSRSMKTISGQKQAAFRKLGVRTDAELFKLEQSLKAL
ncbi:LuxR C-terminal-related transcriptional regulator [Pseudomonas sp. S2_F03]